MRIIILSRNIELYSTARLVEEIEKKGHEALVVDAVACSVVMEKGKPSILYHGEILHNIDAVIPRIGSTITFYGTAIVRQFEMMKTFTTAESQAIIRSRDKLRSLQILSRAGIGIPRTVFANFPKDDEVVRLINKVGGTPVIIKLLEGTQGVGVILAETENSAKSIVEAFSGLQTNILIQEFIKESKGTDIRAFVINGKVVGAMERTGAEGEFRSNLHRGGVGRKISLTREERVTAIKAAKAMGLQIAGVDMMRSVNGTLVLEVNSSPGLEGIETVTGVNIAALIVDYIENNTSNAKNLVKDKIKV
jgi:ribosomal protein S6--L-glutamate ligase